MFHIMCDEFALTLPIDVDFLRAEHKVGFFVDAQQNYFNDYVDKIDKKLNLNQILGNKEVKNAGMNGYTNCFSFGYDSNQVKILYNPNQLNMKLMVKFTASALRNYIYQMKLQLKQDVSAMNIIQKLNEIDIVRLSRLDIAIDYIDEDIKVQTLFEEYQKRELMFFNKRNSEIKISNYIGAETVETLYFNKRSNRSFLRVYNKKLEQEKNNGDMLKTALDCENWTRFELELKQEYAHAMTKIILNCSSENDFIKVLAHAFIDCIKIRALKEIAGAKEIYEDTDYYNKVVDIANNNEKLITTISRDRLSSFEPKYKNLSKNGTMALFKMIKESYSEDDFERFIEKLKVDIDEFELSNEHKKLIEEEKKHSPFF